MQIPKLVTVQGCELTLQEQQQQCEQQQCSHQRQFQGQQDPQQQQQDQCDNYSKDFW